MNDQAPKLVSIVVPVLNEAGCLPALHAELRRVCDPLAYTFEFVFVDDGSTDETVAVMRLLHEQDARVRAVILSRNFGHQAALCAGLERAQGAAVISMDGDLQHPPALIPELLRQYEAGFDVVNTRRLKTERESWLKRGLSAMFYKFFNWAASIRIEPGGADFRLLSRPVVNALNGLPEVRRFLRGLIPWLGFRQTSIDFCAPARHAGVSKYNFGRSLRLAVEGLTSFSINPLRKVALLGCIFATLAFIYGIVAIGVHLFTDKTIPGWTSLFAAMVFMNGFQFLMLGILGEYVGRVLEQVRERPMFIIREEIAAKLACSAVELQVRRAA